MGQNGPFGDDLAHSYSEQPIGIEAKTGQNNLANDERRGQIGPILIDSLKESNKPLEGEAEKVDPPKKKATSASAPMPDVILVYRSVFRLCPRKETWPKLVEKVGDRIDQWRAVCDAWSFQQNSPKNLTGLVDWLNQGIPDYAKAGGKPHPAYQNGASPQPSRASPPSINDSDIILTDAQRKAIETAKQFQEDR
jgi:hypothetical protein